MRVHHLSCGTMCPLAPRVFGIEKMVCHCLLVETGGRLVLVDTGFGEADLVNPSRLPASFRFSIGVQHDLALTAKRQIEALGFKSADVTDLVITHLDLDHAGGLTDFPGARVHVMKAEVDGALAKATFNDRTRYVSAQWAHSPKWQPHVVAAGESWNGFECVRGIEGLPPEILLVPISGHSRGHMGVAVDSDRGWLLHAGDAYYQSSDVRDGTSNGTLRSFSRLVAFNRAQMFANQRRLRELVQREPAVRVFCAHDPSELEHARMQPPMPLRTQ